MSTQAYVDLMFAWGHARLGDEATARTLVAAATEQLAPLGDEHDWLLKAFTHRVEQAIAGGPHDGTWPAGFVPTSELADSSVPAGRRFIQFAADRLRGSSRILEPVEQVDPYTPWKKDASGPSWYLRASPTGTPAEWLQATFDDVLLLADHANGGTGSSSMVHPHGTGRFVEALEAARRAGETDLVAAHLAELQRVVSETVPTAGRSLYLIVTLTAAVRRLGMRDEAAALVDTHRAAELAAYRESKDPERLIICLRLAGIDLWLGRAEAAIPVLEQARHDAPTFEPTGIRVAAIRDYLSAIIPAEWPLTLDLLWAIVPLLPRIPNIQTTSQWYSLRHVEIVERSVFALTTDNFAARADLLRSMPPAEIASRREALVEVRAKLIAWGQPDWGSVQSN